MKNIAKKYGRLVQKHKQNQKDNGNIEMKSFTANKLAFYTIIIFDLFIETHSNQ